MSEALVKTDESKFTEFVPFGAEDKIKLSVVMVKNLIAVKTKTGKTCSDTDAIKFIAMCQARRLNPFEGDAFLIGYDTREDGPKFSLITAHQAFLKRAEIHKEYNGMKSGVIVQRGDQMLDLEGDFYLEDDKLLGGWATVFFKSREHPMHKRIRLKRFQKSFGIWQEDPAGMIVKCAEADALRSSFPTMLGGLYLKEESQLPTEPKMTRPIFNTPAATIQVEAAVSESVMLDTIRESIKKENISEDTLMEFLGAVGLDEDKESLAELSAETLGMIVEQWPDFRDKIKEAQ